MRYTFVVGGLILPRYPLYYWVLTEPFLVASLVVQTRKTIVVNYCIKTIVCSLLPLQTELLSVQYIIKYSRWFSADNKMGPIGIVKQALRFGDKMDFVGTWMELNGVICWDLTGTFGGLVTGGSSLKKPKFIQSYKNMDNLVNTYCMQGQLCNTHWAWPFGCEAGLKLNRYRNRSYVYCT